MAHQGPWVIGAAKESYPDYKYPADFDYVPVPSFVPGQPPKFAAESGWGEVVSKRSQHKDAAFKFMQFMAKPENARDWNITTFTVPSLQALKDDPQFLQAATALLGTLMVLFPVVLIPIYLIVNSLHLLNTLFALIVPSTVSAFGIFLMRQFIAAIRNERAQIFSANLPNTGQAPNRPRDMIVEGPAFADGTGLRPIAQPPLPAALAGTLATRYQWAETIVEAALEGSRTKFIQALVLDGYVESLDQAAALADDLLAAQAAYLPWAPRDK